MKNIKLDKATIDDIIQWTTVEKDWIDKKYAACQSLFPLINIFHCKTVVELGTHWGSSTASLVDNCPSIQKIYTVDNYLPYKDSVPPYVEVTEDDAEFLKLSARKNFSNLPDDLQKKIHIIYGDSIESAKIIRDNSIDFIWFDAHLTREQLARELETWYPKVAYGGIVGVHDCGPNGSNMNQVVYDFMEGKHTKGRMSYYNDTLSWIKDND